MTEKLLLVDFENVQPADLSRVDDDTHVIVFVGEKQKSVPLDLVLSAQQHERSIEWQQVDGNGANALDFHIACHLGRILERAPETHCTVLSKDKGFDPLIRHLNRLGLRCRRINKLPGETTGEPPADDLQYNRVLKILGKCEKKSRPGRRETLSKHIRAMFQNSIDDGAAARIIERMLAEKRIAENNNVIGYHF